MTVYVDDMFRPAQIQGRPAKWSHMFADSTAELLAFAHGLGLRPEWLQHAGTHREHFDVTTSVRATAIRRGAVQITYPGGVAELLDRRRAQCRCKRLPECRWSDLARDETPETIGSPYHHEDERECFYRADGSGWWPYRFEDGVLNRSGASICFRLHPDPTCVIAPAETGKEAAQ